MAAEASPTHAAGGDGPEATSHWAKLVNKLASFRKALREERERREAAERELGEARAALEEARVRVEDREQQVLDLLRENAALQHQVHLIRIEPLPHELENGTEKDVERIFAKKSGRELEDEFRRTLSALNTLKYHHQKLNERAQAERVQSEHERLLLTTELSRTKTGLSEKTQECAALQTRFQELERALNEAREALERAEKKRTVVRTVDKQETTRLGKALQEKDVQLQTLARELAEARSFAEICAQKAFNYKTQLDSFELVIRRYRLALVRPPVSATPVELVVKKIAATGEILVVVLAEQTQREELRRSVLAVTDVHSVKASRSRSRDSLPNSPPAAPASAAAAAVATPQSESFRQLVLRNAAANPHAEPPLEEIERKLAESNAAAAAALVLEQRRQRRFCLVFGDPRRHVCEAEDAESVLLEARDADERADIVANLREFVKLVRSSDAPERPPRAASQAVTANLERFFGVA